MTQSSVGPTKIRVLLPKASYLDLLSEALLHVASKFNEIKKIHVYCNMQKKFSSPIKAGTAGDSLNNVITEVLAKVEATEARAVHIKNDLWNL